MKTRNYKFGIYLLFKLLRKYMDSNHHENFVYEGAWFYYIHSPYEIFSKESAKHHSITEHSMIVHVNPQKTIIDEAVESYPLKRLVSLNEQ
jgi:hypothetical protein